MKKTGGFSTVEVVITTIILAVLAAIATPKLANMSGEANSTAEKKAIKSIEMLYAAAMLANSKSGSLYPTIGSSVGFRPEIPGVTPEPAPDEAPVLFNFGFQFQSLVRYPETARTMTVQHRVVGIYHLVDQSNVFKSCSDLETAVKANYKFVSVPGTMGDPPLYMGVADIKIDAEGNNRGVSRTDSPPACRVSSWKFRTFRTTPADGYEYLDVGSSGQTSANAFYASQELVDGYGFTDGARLENPSGKLLVIGPSSHQFTCEPLTERYGVEYRLQGGYGVVSGRPGLGIAKPFESSGLYTHTLVGFPQDLSTNYYEQRLRTTFISSPTSPTSAKCVRNGPAPELPPAVPADPGSPGKYPLAEDGSGWCVGPGRKLPAFSDENGTPTTSHSDVVREIASDAVDDEIN
jgi:type II secretory pathway pseudopilin PulG